MMCSVRSYCLFEYGYLVVRDTSGNSGVIMSVILFVYSVFRGFNLPTSGRWRVFLEVFKVSPGAPLCGDTSFI